MLSVEEIKAFLTIYLFRHLPESELRKCEPLLGLHVAVCGGVRGESKSTLLSAGMWQ